MAADGDREKDSFDPRRAVPAPEFHAKQRHSVLIMLLGLLLVASGFGGGWWLANSRAKHGELVQLSTSPPSRPVGEMLVTVEPVGYRSVERTIEAVGTLHGYEEVTLSAKVDGRVVKILHDLSSRLEPNDLLIEMDTTDAQLAVTQAERSVQAELAKWGFASVPAENEDLSLLPTVVSARLKYELARSQLQRMEALQATNAIALEEVEKSRSDTLVLESEWKNQLQLAKSAAATVRLKNADLAVAQQRLKDTRIFAPIPTLFANEHDQFYRVSERLVSEGTMLRLGTEVMKIVLGKTLKLRLPVPEAYGAMVAVGQKVEVYASSTNRPSRGTVARIAPAVERTTRTFLVEVEIPNLDGALRPGGFAKAKISVSIDERATTIPLSGLYSFAGINKLFLFDQGVAREVQVALGEQSDSWIEIASPDLPADALVITSGQRLLSDGKPVAIREPCVSAPGAVSPPGTMISIPAESNVLSTVGQKQ